MNHSTPDSSSQDDANRDTRRPRSVYGVGTEPDARFSLANERTALAWVRTGLALVAGGVALTTIATLSDGSVLLDIVAVFACVAGGVLAGIALFSWQRTERALRQDRPLPGPVALPWLIGGVFVMAGVLAGYALFESFARR